METISLTQSELENLVETVALEVLRQMEPAPGAWLSEEIECACNHASRAGAIQCVNDQPPEVRALARLMDHTLLRPQATRTQIEQLADEARQWCFGTICVNSTWVPVAAEKLRGSGVKVAAVVGFPFGAMVTSVKRAEAQAVILAGAEEVDMVMNVGAMKSGDVESVENDIRGVAEVCHEGGALLKVILENAYLSDEEKVEACRIAQRAGADYVKTSTGFAASGATAADVRLMRRIPSACWTRAPPDSAPVLPSRFLKKPPLLCPARGRRRFPRWRPRRGRPKATELLGRKSGWPLRAARRIDRR